MSTVKDSQGREFSGTARFRPRARIGEGKLGRVYHVYDVETGQDVALKTLPALVANDIYYIKQEFRSLRGIRDFNLVELHELFIDGENCFFTMELIEGGLPFTQYIWMQSGRPSLSAGLSDAALTALRRVLRQLAKGVVTLHGKQRFHQDIKPDNVLVTPAGRVVLLDFDMVTHLLPREVHDDSHAGVAGTPQYMSPEQIYSRPMTPATDWYSIGVLLFETLTGEVPLDGSLGDIWARLSNFTLPPLRSLTRSVPDDLEGLVRALLHPHPEGRAGRDEIYTATQELARASMPVVMEQGRAVKTAPFTGRTAELEVLEQGFERSRRNGPALVCIEGTSGIGKTELVDAFLHSISNRALILRGTCHHQESVPYKAFDSLIDDLSRYLLLLERDGAAVPAPLHASALTLVFSVLGRIKTFSDAEKLDTVALQEIRLLAFRALRDLLATIARARPLILWIDDLQWGDADSAPLFRELLRPPDAPRLMLIVSYRSENLANSVLLRSLESLRESKEVWARQVPLGPLNAADSRALAGELLAEETEAAAMDDLVEEAAGSPFFLVQLARDIADGRETEVPSASSGDRLKQILRRRVALLTERERTILEVISVAGKQMDRSLVLKAAGLGESGRRDISRLSQENLVRPTELDERPAIEIYHDRFRQVILGDLPLERRRGLHLLLAEAIQSQPAADPEDLLVHYRGAGDERTAGTYARMAAERAMNTLAFDRAAELYASLVPGDEGAGSRAEIREKLGDALANAGRAEEAGASFEAAAKDLEEASSVGEASAARELRRRAAEQYLCGGHVDRGVEALSQVLRAVGIEYPTSSFRAWAAMVVGQVRLQRRGLGFEERGADTVPPAELARIDAYWSAGLGLAWVDRTRTGAFQVRYTLLALDAGEPRRVALALSVHASQLVSFGGAARLLRGRAELANAERLATGSQDPLLKAFLVMMDGSIAFYDARWRIALDRCRQAEETLRAYSRTTGWEMTTARLLSFAAMIYLGQMTELRAKLPALLDEARTRGNRLGEATLASGLPNMVWLSSDEPEEARRRANDAMDLWKQDDFQMQHYLHLIASTQIDLYQGDGTAALQRIVTAWPRVVTSFLLIVENLRITLHHLRARAALRAALGGDERGRRWWERRAWLLLAATWDAARLEREEAEWARPLALAIRAGVAATRGRVGEASARLEEAARLFDGLEMALYAAAARYQRGALPGGEAARREGDAWMRDHGVVDPEKLAAMLVPGV